MKPLIKNAGTHKQLNQNVTSNNPFNYIRRPLDFNVNKQLPNQELRTHKQSNQNITANQRLDKNVTTNQHFNQTVTNNQNLDQNITTNQQLDQNVTTSQHLRQNITANKHLDRNATINQKFVQNITTYQQIPQNVTTNQQLDTRRNFNLKGVNRKALLSFHNVCIELLPQPIIRIDLLDNYQFLETQRLVLYNSPRAYVRRNKHFSTTNRISWGS